NYQCVCLSGWKGTFCEQDSNDCKMNPCENNCTCIDLDNGYRCMRARGQNLFHHCRSAALKNCYSGKLRILGQVRGASSVVCPPSWWGCLQRSVPKKGNAKECSNYHMCVSRSVTSDLCDSMD
ncbi:unnamed protein product, partial [Rangifer tarandus platyrhynchus]